MTDDIPLTLRLRRLVSDWFPAVVVGLVVLTLLAGAGAYGAHASTEYETEEVVVSSMNESTDFEHSALVRNDSTVWSEGETVQDRPLYYIRLMPVLDVEYGYTYDLDGAAADSQEPEVRARTEVQLVLRAVDGDGATLWRDVRPLASETTDSLAPGERHAATFSLNATRVAQRIGRIESDLGAQVGDVQVVVRARTAVNGSVAGQSLSEEHTSELPLVVRPPTYRVDSAQTAAVGTPLRTDTIRERVEPPLLTRVGAPLGLLAGLAGLVGIAYASRRDMIALSEAERERCDLAEKRKQFDDWITRGEIPGIDQYQTVVKVSSLSGLVDLAIDTNNRVIEDDNAFYVLRGREDVAYVYAPSTSAVHSWLFGGFDFEDGGSFREIGTAGNGGGTFEGGTEGPDAESLFDDDGFGDTGGTDRDDDTDTFGRPEEDDEDAGDDAWPDGTEDTESTGSRE